METFDEGDRVRIDIPDEGDIDHNLHGEHGTVVDVICDDAGATTGRDEDDNIYRVNLDAMDRRVDVRSRDLRPPFDE